MRFMWAYMSVYGLIEIWSGNFCASVVTNVFIVLSIRVVRDSKVVCSSSKDLRSENTGVRWWNTSIYFKSR